MKHLRLAALLIFLGACLVSCVRSHPTRHPSSKVRLSCLCRCARTSHALRRRDAAFVSPFCVFRSSPIVYETGVSIETNIRIDLPPVYASSPNA
jgi:hypothetical protein